MKPAWDALMKEFNTPEFNKHAIIADVDCDAHQELCTAHGVTGFPTIKHGDLGDLQDYEGGRDEAALKAWAKENLGPSCGPSNLDLCSDEQKATIARLDKMSTADLGAAIAKGVNDLINAEDKFKIDVQKLQDDFDQLTKTKEETVKALATPDLAIQRQIKAIRDEEHKVELAAAKKKKDAEEAAEKAAKYAKMTPEEKKVADRSKEEQEEWDRL